MRTPYRMRLKNVPRRVGPDLFRVQSKNTEDEDNRSYTVFARSGIAAISVKTKK